jgi:hypothetical protein
MTYFDSTYLKHCFAGFYIRIMLLSGSSFRKQLIPDTYPLVFLGLLGVLFSAAMQIVLAFYLWTRLPTTYPKVNGDDALRNTYPGTEIGADDNSGRSYYNSPLGFARVPLPAYEFPNYKFANDVCRTVPIVQIVAIGLFLFSILNNVPGVLKNIAIIWFSDRFISVDEEGVTKLHYWRESSNSRESANNFVQFLYDKFHHLFKEKKIFDKLEMLRYKLAYQEFNETKPERLRVRAGIRKESTDEIENKDQEISSSSHNISTKDDNDDSWICCTSVASDSGADSYEAELYLTAFICEMYLSGCVIQDIKNQKRVKDKLDQELKKNCEEKRPEMMWKEKKKRGVTEAHELGPVVYQEIKSEVDRKLKEFKEMKERQILAPLLESHEKEFKAFANAARRRWMLPECFTEILPKKSTWIDWMVSPFKWIGTGLSPFLHCCSSRFPCCTSAHRKLPRSFFEVCETRSFLAEALRLIDRQNNTKQVGFAKDLVVEKEELLYKIVRDNCAVWPPPIDIKLWPRPIQFCDQTRLNLVRIDYLKPNQWSRPSAYFWLKDKEKEEEEEEENILKKALRTLQQETREMEEEKSSAMRNINEKIEKCKEEAQAVDNTLTSKKKKHGPDDVTNFEEESNAETNVLNKERKKVLDNFKKLEDELAVREIALRKAISSLATDKQLRMEKKKRSRCFKKLFHWLYKHFFRVIFRSKPAKQAENPLLTAMRKSLGRDFDDVLSAVSFSRQCPSGMGWFRFFAFLFGVLPEVASLLIMAVAGVQYILWSGFKIGSDTQGMEEIILATLAINFIYEIDDMVYDHVFPELYKEAHERDRFDITGFWISSETAGILDKCRGSSSSWWSWCCSCFSCCSDNPTTLERDIEEEDGLRMLIRCDPLSWETNSKHQVKRGCLIGNEDQNSSTTQQEENVVGSMQQAGGVAGIKQTSDKDKKKVSNGKTDKMKKTPYFTCSACVGFVDLDSDRRIEICKV